MGYIYDLVRDLFGSPVADNMSLRYCVNGQILGQAFMNAIPTTSYDKLSGSVYDPFYSDELYVVLDAIDYLTRG